MVEREYLNLCKFLFTCSIKICLVVSLYIPASFASAWLPAVGSYKYHFSTAKTDKKSKAIRGYKGNIYLRIERLIHLLTEAQMRVDTSRSSGMRKAARLQSKIDALKNTLNKLNSYQDEQLITNYIEYGVTNDQSFGIKTIYKTHQLPNSTNSAAKSNTKTIDIFYKFKLFQNINYIFTLQPAISISKNRGYANQLFQELTLLVGNSGKMRSRNNKMTDTFIDIAVSVGSCISSTDSCKRYYSFAVSEGIKLPYGVMISNYSKYTVRKDHNLIYSKTLYDQLAIAKQFYFKKPKAVEFTLQVGYFWDKSLKYSAYRISGPIFSLLLDI